MLNLKINLGSDDLPRYQCGNHKLDIVGRKAVKSHPQLLNITKKINKSNVHEKYKKSRIYNFLKYFFKKYERLLMDAEFSYLNSTNLLENLQTY